MSRVDVSIDANGDIRFEFEDVNLSSPAITAGLLAFIQGVREDPSQTVKVLAEPVRILSSREALEGAARAVKHMAGMVGYPTTPTYSYRRHGQATWCGGVMRHGGHEFGLLEYEPDRPRWCLGMPNHLVDRQAEGCGLCPDPVRPDEAFHPGWQGEHVIKNDDPPRSDEDVVDFIRDRHKNPMVDGAGRPVDLDPVDDDEDF